MLFAADRLIDFGHYNMTLLLFSVLKMQKQIRELCVTSEIITVGVLYVSFRKRVQILFCHGRLEKTIHSV